MKKKRKPLRHSHIRLLKEESKNLQVDLELEKNQEAPEYVLLAEDLGFSWARTSWERQQNKKIQRIEDRIAQTKKQIEKLRAMSNQEYFDYLHERYQVT